MSLETPLCNKKKQNMFIKLESTVNTIERKFIYMRDADFLISSASAGFIIIAFNNLQKCRNIYNAYGIVMVYLPK